MSDEGLSGFFEMAETGSQVRVPRRTVADRWAIATPAAEREDKLPLELAVPKWTRIYQLFDASSESSQDEVFAAVNQYFLANGCSPSGNYSRAIRTAGGSEATSGDVVKIIGRMDGEIRQFLRARMKDSFEALKYAPAVASDDFLRSRAEARGIPRDKCYLLADWLTDCPYFDAVEARLASALSVKTIAEANARYGQSGKKHNKNVDEVVEVDTPEGMRGGSSYVDRGYVGSQY